MMAAKFLASDKLAAWLAELASSRRVLVPVRERDAVVFRPFGPGVAPALGRKSDVPPKAAVFPATERLMAFKYVKNPDDLGQVSVEVTPTVEAPPAVVFGSRPCDARGFLTFDRVYGCPSVTDPYYKARRENTLFVTLACEEPDNACFCNSMGSSPSDPEGSDVLLTPIEGGFLAQDVSRRGKELLSSNLLADGSKLVKKAKAVHAAALEAMGAAWSPEKAPASLIAKFDDTAFWEEMSSKCVSCGACTYLCPTCYCFNVTDERTGMKGERIRTWDNCMSYLFTLEASGHNPRPTKAHRLKNRVGHKFSYYPGIHGAFACCGCGRCIALCPASVDIREIVRLAIERPAGEPAKK
ncbi:MAG: 4Fe-4S dicluster domain-containing protein [Thermodesulfobacteriota bacterium]